MNLLSKIKFLLQKPKVVIIVGNGRQTAKEAIFQVLKQHFSTSARQQTSYGGSAVALREGGKVGLHPPAALSLSRAPEILIFETDLKNSTGVEKVKFLVKNSSLPILVITNVGDIPPDKEFFAGEKEETIKIRELAKTFPTFSYLVLNFDDETVREIKDETNLKELTFGFQKEADFSVSDIKLNSGTNFKINHRGNIVPVWLEEVFGKEQIYAGLAAAAVGMIFNLNLVEVSQALKSYQGLPGKMKLIEGIKNSRILDNTNSATLFSMIEAIEILGKISPPPLFEKSGGGRKIAVLGDIIGIGKYTVEAHETIGEKVAQNSDLLFTFGSRAKFIAEGAKSKGMPVDKIFQFDTIEDGKLKLQEETKEGDLILVGGSKEMKMEKIVEEIQIV